METAIYNISGKETGKKALLMDEIFGIEPNDHAIYLDVKQYLANRRQGTHKSKQRNEVAGSTRKDKKIRVELVRVASSRRCSRVEVAYSVRFREIIASS